MKVYILLLAVLLVSHALALYTSSQIETDILETDLVGWQPCLSWAFSQVGPSVDEIKQRCGADIAISCRSVGSTTIKLWAEINRDLLFDNVGDTLFEVGNITYYRTQGDHVGFTPSIFTDFPVFNATSNTTMSNFTFVAGEEPVDCASESGDMSMCWYLVNQRLATGGYCGNLGAVGGPTVEKIIYHSPCGGNTTGSCVEGSACVTAATCNANETCVPTTEIDYSVLDTDCVTFTCDQFSGNSTPTFLAQFTPCDDGSNCTTGASCDGAGFCNAGTPKTCPLSDTCSLSLGCLEATGECELLALNGSCTPSNPCLGAGTCSNFTCVDGPPVVCPTPGGDSCRSSTGCNIATGVCEFSVITSGPCTPTANNCSLAAECSVVGVCEETVREPCNTPPVCQGVIGNGTCVDFQGCQYENDDGASCSLTGDLCAEGFVCSDGNCLVSARKACPGGGNCERPGNCDKNTGLCPTPTPLPFGTTCNHGDPCIRDAFCNGATSCLPGPSLDCAVSLGPCFTSPVCLVGGGCNGTALSGVACNTGDPCNPGVCETGRCITVDLCGGSTGSSSGNVTSPAATLNSALFTPSQFNIFALPAA